MQGRVRKDQGAAAPRTHHLSQPGLHQVAAKATDFFGKQILMQSQAPTGMCGCHGSVAGSEEVKDAYPGGCAFILAPLRTPGLKAAT